MQIEREREISGEFVMMMLIRMGEGNGLSKDAIDEDEMVVEDGSVIGVQSEFRTRF